MLVKKRFFCPKRCSAKSFINFFTQNTPQNAQCYGAFFGVFFMKNKFKLTKILLNNRYFLNFHSVNDPEHATNFFFGSKNMFLCWYKRPKRLVMFTGCLGMIRNKNIHHRGPVGQPETSIVTVFLPARNQQKRRISAWFE